jgi:hypothetical protein
LAQAISIVPVSLQGTSSRLVETFATVILVEEQDHLIAQATALGVDPPDAGIAD